MTSPSHPSTPQDEAPIDAEFEPAEISNPGPKRAGGSGPGWPAFFGVLMIALLAVGLGAATAGWIPGLKLGSGNVSALEARIAELETQVAADTTATNTLSGDIATLKSRADSLMADRTRASGEFRNLQTEIETLQADISTLQRARVASLADGDPSEAAEGAAPDVTGLGQRVTALEDAMVSQLSAYDTRLETLRSRLSALEELAEADRLTAADLSNARTEAALALSAIEAAARRGRPFLTAYQRLDAAMPDNDAVDRLAAIAPKAIPTLSDLQASFSPLIAEALDQSAAAEGGNANWMRAVFGDGIQVRRTGELSLREQLDQAQSTLQSGDLNAAIEQIQALDANLQPVFTDWLNSAQDRNQLEQTLEALRLSMIAKERP